MSKSEYSEPAFPVLDLAKTQCHGMTLRDYFAAKAMQGIIACPSSSGSFMDLADEAYEYADAMLRARDGGGDDAEADK